MRASVASVLRQEADVVVEERPDLVDAVADHRDALEAEAEREPGVLLGVDADRRGTRWGRPCRSRRARSSPSASTRGSPSPSQKMQLTASSADGSVYGKKSERNRVRIDSSSKSARTNVSMVPNRSASVMPRSTASASIWWNTGEWRGVERLVAVRAPGRDHVDRRLHASPWCGSAPATCACAASPARDRRAPRRACPASSAPDGPAAC